LQKGCRIAACLLPWPQPRRGPGRSRRTPRTTVTTHPRTGGVPLRRLAAAILAVPVIATIYVALLLANPGARRSLAAIGATLLVAVVGISMVLPSPAVSRPPSTPSAVPEDRFSPVETGLTGPATESPSPTSDAVVANAPVGASPASAALQPAPVTAVVPKATPTAAPATVTTPKAQVRVATTAQIIETQPSGNRIRPTSAITLKFNRSVSLKQVRAAFTIKPAVKGTIKALNARVYTFTPSAPLAANTPYLVSLAKPIRDSDGVAVASLKPISLLTVAAPALIRFRPTKGTPNVDPTQQISIRFSLPMNHATTQRAFQVVIAGRKVAGKVTWAENNTVLVFAPLKPLPKNAGVGIRLLGTATSLDGVQIKKGGSATFDVIAGPKAATTTTTSKVKVSPKPVVKPVTKPTTKPTPKPGSGGGSLGGGAWAAAEHYYLTLMNCTRTGGYVTSSGGCSSPGGRNVAPLWIDEGISANVSRPYARYLASTGICSHFADGNPGNRLRRAGYDSYRWAENISCPKDMNVMALMVYTQQYFQAEGWGGGHYINLMNA